MLTHEIREEESSAKRAEYRLIRSSVLFDFIQQFVCEFDEFIVAEVVIVH